MKRKHRNLVPDQQWIHCGMRQSRPKRNRGFITAEEAQQGIRSQRHRGNQRRTKGVCKITLFCDKLDGGDFVKLFPQYRGENIVIEHGKPVENMEPEVVEYLSLLGKI